MILFGEEASKRTVYMKKAATDFCVPLQVIGWEAMLSHGDLGQLRGRAVKIDPPSYETVCLHHMQGHLKVYQKALQRLAQAECVFLNSPEAVCTLLDKRKTKQCLQERGLPVTEMFSEKPGNTEQLLELMRQRHCYSVFVKPGYFSGAAGVVAFRMHPVQGRMRLYTSCLYRGGELVNTRRLFCMDDREEICRLLNRILSFHCVVERWHPKADFDGKSYDLRVVFQFEHIAYIVVRRSGGPITNLHLNNQAAQIQELGLHEDKIQEIAGICKKALSLFPGLSMAGIDILLERETLRPLIIEMNGQGDLIYQDIYGENQIYREQVQRLSGLEKDAMGAG